MRWRFEAALLAAVFAWLQLVARAAPIPSEWVAMWRADLAFVPTRNE